MPLHYILMALHQQQEELPTTEPAYKVLQCLATGCVTLDQALSSPFLYHTGLNKKLCQLPANANTAQAQKHKPLEPRAQGDSSF